MASHDNYPAPSTLTLESLKENFKTLGADVLRSAKKVYSYRNLQGETVRKDYVFEHMTIALNYTNDRVTSILTNGVVYAELPLVDSKEVNLLMCYHHLTKLFFIEDIVFIEGSHGLR